MHNRALPYILRTARLFQSCHCLLGVRIPSLLRNCGSRSGLLILHEIKAWTPASIATSISVRFFSQETSISGEEKTTLSVTSDSSSSHSNRVPALNEEYSLETDQGHSQDREKTMPQSSSTGPPKTFSPFSMLQSTSTGPPKTLSPFSMLQSTSTGPPKTFSGVESLDAFSSHSHSLHELYCCIMDLSNVLANKNIKPSDKQLMSEHPNFYNLCYEVMTAAPKMSDRFLVCSLHVFLSLKVNQNTRLIRTLLSVCQQRLINGSLKIDEISLLASCLKMMESDKNVAMLHSGLCLLIEHKCDTIKDVKTLQNLMRIAPAHLRQKIEEKVLQMIDTFTISQCFNMFSVLEEINLCSESLLDPCSQKLISCLDELSCKRIRLLSGCCSKLMYFNEKLLSAIGDNIMKNIYMWDVWQISVVLSNMSFLYFRHVPLLDYFANKLMEESQSLKINYLITAAKVYAMVNHLPEGKGDKFLETLDTALHLHINSLKRKDLLRIVYNFCTLGLVPQSAINRLLEDESLSTLDRADRFYLSQIKRCLFLDLGSSPFSIQDLEKAETYLSHSVTLCHTFLKNYFEDPALYQENMKFPSSYFIDFVLTLDRKQNKLVPTGDLQNVDGSQDVTRIALLCCTANAFTLGTLHPNGQTALKLRNLKSLGFTSVMVPVNQFLMLSEAEKEAFLRENIFKNNSTSQTSVEAKEADYTLRT